MAEILLRIGDHPSGLDSHSKDGDILHAFSDRCLGYYYASQICHIKHAGFTSDGLRPRGLAEKLLMLTRQYKVERISRRVVRRTNLFTGDIEEYA